MWLIEILLFVFIFLGGIVVIFFLLQHFCKPKITEMGEYDPDEQRKITLELMEIAERQRHWGEDEAE